MKWCVSKKKLSEVRLQNDGVILTVGDSIIPCPNAVASLDFLGRSVDVLSVSSVANAPINACKALQGRVVSVRVTVWNQMQTGGSCGSQTSLSVQFACRWYWRKI